MCSELRFNAVRSPGEVDYSVVIAACARGTCHARSDEIAAPAGLFFGPPFCHAEAQCVAHSFFFGPQILEGVGVRRSLAADHGNHLDAAFGQRAGFARIVREQTNPFDAEIAHDRGREAEVPAIGLEPEGVIGSTVSSPASCSS